MAGKPRTSPLARGGCGWALRKLKQGCWQRGGRRNLLREIEELECELGLAETRSPLKVEAGRTAMQIHLRETHEGQRACPEGAVWAAQAIWPPRSAGCAPSAPGAPFPWVTHDGLKVAALPRSRDQDDGRGRRRPVGGCRSQRLMTIIYMLLATVLYSEIC